MGFSESSFGESDEDIKNSVPDALVKKEGMEGGIEGEQSVSDGVFLDDEISSSVASVDSIKAKYGIALSADDFHNEEQLGRISEQLASIQKEYPKKSEEGISIKQALNDFVDRYALDKYVRLDNTLSSLGDILRDYKKHNLKFDTSVMLKAMEKSFHAQKKDFLEKRYDLDLGGFPESDSSQFYDTLRAFGEENPHLGLIVKRRIQSRMANCKKNGGQPHVLSREIFKDIENGQYSFDLALRRSQVQFHIGDAVSDYNLDNLKKTKPSLHEQIMQSVAELENGNLTNEIFQEEFGVTIEQYVLWRNIVSSPQSFVDTGVLDLSSVGDNYSDVAFFGGNLPEGETRFDNFVSSAKENNSLRVVGQMEATLLKKYEIKVDNVLTETVKEESQSDFQYESRSLDSGSALDSSLQKDNKLTGRNISLDSATSPTGIRAITKNAIPSSLGSEIVNHDIGVFTETAKGHLLQMGIDAGSVDIDMSGKERDFFDKGVGILQKYQSVESVPPEEIGLVDFAIDTYSDHLEEMVHASVGRLKEASVGGIMRSCVDSDTKRYLSLNGAPTYSESDDVFSLSYSLPDGFRGSLDFSNNGISGTDYLATDNNGCSLSERNNSSIGLGIETPKSILSEMSASGFAEGTMSLEGFSERADEIVQRKTKENIASARRHQSLIASHIANIAMKSGMAHLYDTGRDVGAKSNSKKISQGVRQRIAILAHNTLHSLPTVKSKCDMTDDINELGANISSPRFHHDKQLMSYMGGCGDAINLLESFSTARKNGGRPAIHGKTLERRNEYVQERGQGTIPGDVLFSDYAEIGGSYRMPLDVKNKIREMEDDIETKSDLSALSAEIDSQPNTLSA